MYKTMMMTMTSIDQISWISSVLIPIQLIITFLPNSNHFIQTFILSCLLCLSREFRLRARELWLQRRAKASHARLAPHAPSFLPFGLSLIQHRLRSLTSGKPSDNLDLFQSFPNPTSIIRTRALGIESIITLSHLDAKYLLSTGFQNWGKSPHFKQAFEPLLGDGVFASDQRGLWAWHRALTRPHFARERIADVHAIEEHSTRIVNWLEKKAHDQTLVDLQDVFARFTLTVGTQHLLGTCIDSLNDLLADRPVESGGIDTARFAKDFADAQDHCLRLVLLPSLIRRLAVLYKPKSIKGVFEVIDSLVAKSQQATTISSSTESKPVDHEIHDQKDQPENLLDHLRRSECSANQLRHESLNILLAARDTTASLLTSCIYELAGRDQIWNRLQSEASAGLPDPSQITLEQIRQLKYLRAVINETLRLHPPVWANTRHAFEDDVLPSGVFVPAGTDVRFMIFQMQRNPEVWGNDAEEFVPERWLDGRQSVQSKDPLSFQPFSAGPRICLGQQFAYTEVSITLAKLVLAFSKIELSASRDGFKEVPSVTLSVRGGLWVKLHV